VTRIRALVAKELLDISRNRGALIPVVLVVLMSLTLPLVVVVLIPRTDGHSLSEDAGSSRSRQSPGSRNLTVEGQIQFFMLQQFLMLFLLTPITVRWRWRPTRWWRETSENARAAARHSDLNDRVAGSKGAGRADPDVSHYVVGVGLYAFA
jgi:hypothetical protein